MQPGRAAIVLVDDEKLVLDSLTEQLRSHFRDRFLYESAENVAEAWEVIEELCAHGTPIIVVVSDWLMPGTRGDDFLVELRARHPHVASIMLTGQADASAIERVLSVAGASAVIQKPWRAEELRGLIEKHAGDADPGPTPA